MRTVVVAILAAFVSNVAYGQMGPTPGGFGPEGFRRGPGFRMQPNLVVTGAPYTASVTTEFTQTLAGGNSIHRTVTGSIARDGSGRVLTEETVNGSALGGATPRTMKFVLDPVGGYSYTFDSARQIVTKRPFHIPNEKTTTRESRPDEASKNPDVSVTSTTGSYLGLTVQIKTITRTIPAGKMGNEAPIVSTSQVYYSPDLQTVVYSTRSDPRSGETTYKLTGIQTGEPPAADFQVQVPAGYTMQEVPAGGRRGTADHNQQAHP